VRIAFIARTDLYSISGGDTVQIEGTARALRQLGVTVTIHLSHEAINYNDYDLLHFFNIIDCEDILGHVMRTKVPYVVSTIYVDYREYDRYHRGGVIGLLSRFFSYDAMEFIKKTAKWLKGDKISTLKYFAMGNRRAIRYILEHAAYLLPNSTNEYNRLVKDYGIKKQYTVVPNAVDNQLFSYSPHDEQNRHIVLCVARIEGRKNQLNLIRALKGTGYKLVLIGRPSVNQKKYVEQCKAEAGENVTFIDHIAQPELLKYYLKAKVHVLPSWFETTGLSSLEAGSMGCNVVVGDRGDVREYFGDFAYYCNPGDVSSVKQAVEQAYHASAKEELRLKIQHEFNWEKAAEMTWKTYNKVLEHD
jgi:glycosyltransferase involved in cell wall biosynthesis